MAQQSKGPDNIFAAYANFLIAAGMAAAMPGLSMVGAARKILEHLEAK